MKRYILVLSLFATAMFFAGCNGDDNGGTQPEHKIKLIKSIISYEEISEGIFTYDDKDRVTTITFPSLEYKYAYSANSITVTESDDESDYYITTYVLNANGYISSSSSDDYLNSFEYENGYLVKAAFVSDENETETSQIDLTWEDGLNTAWNASFNDSGDNYKYKNNYKYTSYDNNRYNIDLNALLGVSPIDPEIMLLGFFGKRSKYLIEKSDFDEYYDGEWQNFNSQMIFRYEFDDDGYVTKIYFTEDEEESLYYEITYIE